MDLWTSLQVLARRWYVFIPLLIITAATGYVTTVAMAPVYEVHSSVVLLGPEDPQAGAAAANPYLNFDGSLETTAQLLVNSFASDAYVTQLQDRGASGGFVVSSPGGPIVDIVADGASPDEAIATAEVVTSSLRADLKSRQLSVGASNKALIRVQTLVPPTNASYQIGSRVRVLAALGVVGVAGSVFLTFGFESLARARRRHLLSGLEQDLTAGPMPASPHRGLEGHPDDVGALASGGTHRYGKG
jgi:hypothetical protein